MEPEGAVRRLAAIVSADVVDYSRLMAEDEAATVRTLRAYREQIGALISEHRGRLADFSGDNFLAEFPTALDAVQCAIEIQRVLQARNAALPPERKMEFRMGTHLGDVRVEEGRIFGDGVNIAARLEGLAAPGGICISATVHEQVRTKLDVGFVDRGDQTVKNIPDQVHVYDVRLEEVAGSGRPPARRPWRAVGLVATASAVAIALGIWATWPRVLGLGAGTLGLIPAEQPALPDQPSIVVLPFENMSGDPEQEYFADGITEDVTTDLSRNPELFVISRNSAFSYKGESPRVEDVGRELGVRYVLEGSVRRAGDRVRITAQLIDATTGFHVWSERYDRAIADVFAVQSEISEEILIAVGVEIDAAERARLQRKPTEDFTAYESVSTGWAHFYRFTRKDHEVARRLAQRALELDPQYAEALALLASTYQVEYGQGWTLDPTLLDRARELALRALELGVSTEHAHVSLAYVALQQGQPDDAAAHARNAVEIAPNSFNGHFFVALAMFHLGRRQEALEAVRRAVRLDPRRSAAIAVIHYMAGSREKAARIMERQRAASPDMTTVRSALIAYYVSEDRLEEAREIAAEILAINPELTAEWLARQTGSGSQLGADSTASWIASLRRAGLP